MYHHKVTYIYKTLIGFLDEIIKVHFSSEEKVDFLFSLSHDLQQQRSDNHSYSLTSLKFLPASWRETHKSQFLLNLVLTTVNFGHGLPICKTR